MKKLAIIASIALALAGVGYAANTMIGVASWVVVNGNAATPIVLTNAVTLCNRVTLVGKKDNRTANTGTVYIGMTSANDTQVIEIGSGLSVGLLIPEGSKIDLSQFYLDVVTANDGLLIIYE